MLLIPTKDGKLLFRKKISIMKRAYFPTALNRSNSSVQSMNGVILSGLLMLSIVVTFAATSLEYIGRDSGVYLYVGQRILAGDIPYVDVWDHKGPALYYINALGLWIGNGSLAGVVFLEHVFLLIAVWLCYLFLVESFGRLPAIFATVVFLLSVVLILYPGNAVEQYALPIQFLALYSFWKAETSSSSKVYSFLIGATAAIGLLLRPNIVGLQLSIGLYLVLSMLLQHERMHRLIQAGRFVAGVISVLLPVLFYFGITGALDALWDAVVRFNLVYSSGSVLSKLSVPLQGFEYLKRSGIIFIALIGWASAPYFLLRTQVKNVGTPLYMVALIDLPVELVLVSVSGRTYPHYFLIMLPVLTLLCAIFASQFLYHVSRRFLTPRYGQVPLASFALLAILGLMSFLPARAVMWGIQEVLNGKSIPSDLVEYVEEHTAPGSYLLIWGAEAKYNFLTGRPSPTRYAYQSPVFTTGYLRDDMIQELLNDIQEKKPLIIDASQRNRKVPPLEIDQRISWSNPDIVARASPILKYIDEHYEQVATIGNQNWPVMVYRESKE
jgi:hypothetical protein